MTFEPKKTPRTQSSSISFRYDNADERQRIADAAKDAGMNVSQFIREAVKYAMANMKRRET
tara:strand:- start:490 stop:672 length:183 start_codon:yes stop_codon:yes gene_type:complete